MNVVVKTAKVLFVMISLVLVCALLFACIQVISFEKEPSGREPSDESKTVYVPSAPESSEESLVSESTAPVSSEEESVEESVYVSSEEPEVSVTEQSEESTEDLPASSEEPSESAAPPEESQEPPENVGSSEPITPPPTDLSVTSGEFDSMFNDSLFVGHSVMVHFKMYVGGWRDADSGVLGSALFACTSSFSFFNNLNQTPEQADNVLPRYRGSAYRIEDLPAATGAKKIYLGLMGLNDLGMVGDAESCAGLVAGEVFQTIENIKAKNPEVEIAVLASTYLVRGKSFRNLNNRNMSRLNNLVLEYCNQNGIDFIDVATPLTDGDGYLADVYCSDAYCHLKQNAYVVWMDVLHDYAQKKSSGSWKNPESIPLFEE